MRGTTAHLVISVILVIIGGIAYGYAHFLSLPPPAVAGLTASFIAPSALLFVLRCLPEYVARSRVFASLFIALFLINAAVRYSLYGSLMNTVSLTLTVFLTYSLAGWVYSAVMLSRGAGFSLPRLSIAVADVVGRVALAVLAVLVSVALISLALMLVNNAPILAGDKVVVPSPGIPRVIKAGEAVEEINVSTQDHAATVDVLGQYVLTGMFEGNITNPLNSIVETPFGRLVITSELARKVRPVEGQIPASDSGDGALPMITYPLASIWQTYAPLLDPRVLAILAGTALFGIGTKLVGVRGGE